MAISGFVESASKDSVVGWAYDSASPSTHLEITVRIGDEFCASGFADIHRNDLLSVGIGDGTHGFSVDLTPENISNEDAAALVVHAISGAEIVELTRANAKSDRITELTSAPPAPITDESQTPVFVLGSARSGTSAMTLALLDSGSYIGNGEGHLMPLAHVLLSTIDAHYNRLGKDPNTALGRVSVDAFQKLIRRSFIELAPDLYRAGRWLDKTPTVEMVQAAPLMKELWPNARFLFMKRRVIENVLSRRRKFPQDPTDRHYSDWVAVMKAWLAVRDKLGDSAMEIEHRTLVTDTDAVATSIGEFLNLPASAAARFSRYLTSSRPEQTDDSFGATYSFDRLELSEQDARQMRIACDPVMTAFGYGYDESYFANGGGA